mgnify:CR=1 FL=1
MRNMIHSPTTSGPILTATRRTERRRTAKRRKRAIDTATKVFWANATATVFWATAAPKLYSIPTTMNY